jgi:hypothetical protein
MKLAPSIFNRLVDLLTHDEDGWAKQTLKKAMQEAQGGRKLSAKADAAIERAARRGEAFRASTDHLRGLAFGG